MSIEFEKRCHCLLIGSLPVWTFPVRLICIRQSTTNQIDTRHRIQTTSQAQITLSHLSSYLSVTVNLPHKSLWQVLQFGQVTALARGACIKHFFRSWKYLKLLSACQSCSNGGIIEWSEYPLIEVSQIFCPSSNPSQACSLGNMAPR